ncbi:iron uptake system component EfeO [Rhodobacter aestuarii]|uniref:Iron uptake system component EfeO/high-affinity iron transporter n=1 Tax=Rhodobacter aestuarii TaxID=453582 RepID=A0A1N7KYA2_9RHOB|nr:cupredoxin domain-containing protein [Rhodobacter aestuarii]PTV95505.1 iron uptake system component EfeO [Rhodobacter aestuarii]SIS66517.1 iron uptake system component EfeO/high-affinity iron transporter [Rhodobacter aestuarii]
MTTSEQQAPSSKLSNTLIAAGVIATMGGIGIFWSVSAGINPVTDDATVITVDGNTCAPFALELPAGKTTFQIINASDRPLEWEILDGVMVVAERENIAPGFSASLTEVLKPGSYEITCGLLSSPRGSLEVLPTAASEAARTAPPVAEFVGPLAERKVQLMRAGSKFAKSTKALHAALVTGDLDGAKTAWLSAAQDWARLGPVSLRAADLTNRIAPHPEMLVDGETDLGFIGLTRIEYALFAQGSAAGLAPLADALVEDASALQARIKALKAAPADMAADAAKQASILAEGQIAAGLSRHAGADAALLGAALDGLKRSMAAELPLIAGADAALGQAIEAAFGAAEQIVTATPYDPVASATAFGALADALSRVNRALSLEI